MRIHTDTLTSADVYNACDAATRSVSGTKTVRPTRLELHGSRKRARAFDVILTGSNSRRQNGGQDYAATYDEWGYFLAHLFARDPQMTCDYYDDAADFQTKTDRRYVFTSV